MNHSSFTDKQLLNTGVVVVYKHIVIVIVFVCLSFLLAGSHAGGGKAFMKLCGVDLGPPRLPVLPLTPENVRGLETDLRDIGYFEWS